jgi:hypothetical protein
LPVEDAMILVTAAAMTVVLPVVWSGLAHNKNYESNLSPVVPLSTQLVHHSLVSPW